MRAQTQRVISLLIAGALAAVSSVAVAQDAAPPEPAREMPRPQDIDPAVNTSETPPAARETPRPEDIDPAVDTSPPTPAPSAAAAASQQQEPADTPPADAQQPARQAARGGGRAQDRIELDTTQITGNRELPKVLYIVPWKRSDLGDLVGKPVNSLLDEVLTPVDRDVFKRENRYYRALTPGAAENDALSANEVRRPTPVRETPASAPPGAGSPGSATSDLPRPRTGSGSAAPPAGNER